jgi:hypothetical protein
VADCCNLAENQGQQKTDQQEPLLLLLLGIDLYSELNVIFIIHFELQSCLIS